jgi:outer membrane lipoprotein-sorting protein
MKNVLIGLGLALAVFVAAHAEAQPSGPDIVAALDRARNPGQGFRVTSTMTEFVGGKPRNHMTLVVYAREDKKTRQYSNVIGYVEPARDVGKKILFNGSNMWFYDPSSKASVRISPQQRLLGQASNGDVATVNLAKDYNATLVAEETLLDADRQNRTSWHLDLKAATDEAVYSRVEMWVEKGSYHQVKAKFYSDSGRLLKIAYYHKFQEALGRTVPGETIIIDAVDTNLVTTMGASDYRAQDIPDSWFQRDFLPHLKID